MLKFLIEFIKFSFVCLKLKKTAFKDACSYFGENNNVTYLLTYLSK
jgi:hypothetical protein